MEKKMIYTIDAIILVGTLIVMFFVLSSINTGGVSLSPEGGEPWLFKYENCRGDCWIFVDDSPKMLSPNEYYVEDATKITLEQGTYYWNIKGTFEEQEPIKLNLLDRTDFFVYSEEETYFIYVNGKVEIEGGEDE